MKKTLALILAIIMMLSLVSVFASAEGESEAFTGEGTEASPYIIKNAKNLVYLREQVAEGNSYAGKYFAQNCDIDLGNQEWTPIGTSPKPFSGVYNGLGHEIKGFSMTQNPGIVGLFGFICSTADYECGICNLTLSGNVKIDGINAAIAIGAFTGWAYKDATDGFKTLYLTNLVNNVNFEITNVTNQPRFGAVAGYAFCAYFENVVNNGNIVYTGSAVSRVGGIAGQSNRSTFTGCVNNGTIDVSLSTANVTAAGICPIVTYKVDNVYTTFTNCINNGKITAKTAGTNAAYVAGIACNPYSSKTNYYFKIENCANTADIYGEVNADSKSYAYVGGIMAYGNKGEWQINKCINTGTISSVGGPDKRQGGIVSVCSSNADDATVIFADNYSTVPAFGYSAHDKGTYTDDTPLAVAKAYVDAIAAKIEPSIVKINGFSTAYVAPTEPTPSTADSAVYFVIAAVVVAVLGTAVLVKRKEN